MCSCTYNFTCRFCLQNAPSYFFTPSTHTFGDTLNKDKKMKNSALVDGVVISREQAEKALEEMNRPSFKPGDKVTWSKHNRVGFICGPVLNKLFDKEYGALAPGCVRLIDVNGDGSYTANADLVTLLEPFNG